MSDSQQYPYNLCLIENLWHIHNVLSKNWLFSTVASLKKWLARISTRVSTKFFFFAQIFRLRIFAHFLRIKCNKFCAVLRFFASFAQTRKYCANVNSYAKHANWPKLTVSAQKQTTEGLFKNYDFVALNWLLLVTKSSNWGTKINKTEIRWCVVFLDVWIFLCC